MSYKKLDRKHVTYRKDELKKTAEIAKWRFDRPFLGHATGSSTQDTTPSPACDPTTRQQLSLTRCLGNNSGGRNGALPSPAFQGSHLGQGHTVHPDSPAGLSE